MDDQAVVEQSPEDRLAAFLEKEESTPAHPDDEPEEQEQQDEDEGIEAKDDDAEDSDEETEARLLKLKYNGEEIEKPEDEVIALAQQGFDYTAKTQKLAEERKQVEMYAHAIKAQEQSLAQQAALQQAFIKDFAKVESLNEQIAQYEALDWNQLSDNDPVQAQKLYIAYQQTMNLRTQAAQEVQQKQQQLSQHQAQSQRAALEQAKAELLKTFPNWNEQMANDLRAAGKQYGYTDAELSAVTDPRTVKLLADAAAYRKLQSDKAGMSKKVADKPAVVKPGAKNTNAAKASKTTQLHQNLKKSGRVEDAAALLERFL